MKNYLFKKTTNLKAKQHKSQMTFPVLYTKQSVVFGVRITVQNCRTWVILGFKQGNSPFNPQKTIDLDTELDCVKMHQ